jgi:uncharacterized 2Fe-2S/4Fe-4S cluster protein (DUF4445 family)
LVESDLELRQWDGTILADEGAKISMGMPASSGAISEVTVNQNEVHWRVLADVAPRGLRGSGLVDAVAAGLDLGVITLSGRFADRHTSWMLAAPVALTQNDIR